MGKDCRYLQGVDLSESNEVFLYLSVLITDKSSVWEQLLKLYL